MATLKQKAAVKRILENPGIAISKAMREVGYDENTARNPSDLTESKGFQELMGDRLSDEVLVEAHLSLLQNKYWEAKARGLDMAYKVRGKYQSTIVDNSVKIIITPSELIKKYDLPSDPEHSSS